MSVDATDVRRARDERVVVGQALVSICLLVAALLFWEGAADLRATLGQWEGWSAPLVVAAILAGATGVAPWLWPGCTVWAQRVGAWGSLALATAVALPTMVVLELHALLGCQLVLSGACLAELGSRRHVLRWFLGSAAVLVLTYVIYHQLVDLRPVPD